MISIEIVYRTGSNTAVHGSFCHTWRYFHHQARIKRLGNKVVPTKAKGFATISCRNHIRCFLGRDIRDGLYRSCLHFAIDFSCTNIKRTTKQKWKTEYVVDLIRVIRSTGRNDGIIPHTVHQIRTDFRVRIGQCQNKWRCRHTLDLIAIDNIWR